MNTPSKAALDVTGDLDIRIDAAMVTWVTGTSYNVLGRWQTATGLRGFAMTLSAGGYCQLYWSSDGTASSNAVSNAPHGLAAGQRTALRYTLDVDNGASQRVVTFYKGTSLAGPWTMIGTPVVAAGVTSLKAPAIPLYVGRTNDASNFANGDIFGAQVRNGIDGPLVASPDFTNLAVGATAHTDAQGNVWAIAPPPTIVADPAVPPIITPAPGVPAAATWCAPAA